MVTNGKAMGGGSRPEGVAEDANATAPRNDRLFDLWSLTHVAWAFVLTLLAGPLIAFAAMVVWEPLEIFVLSPLLGRLGISFGRETWRNSLSDIGFDAAGVVLGMLVLAAGFVPPFGP